MNYSLSQLTSSRYQLCVQGACNSVNWMAALSMSLSASRISIIAAQAVREEPNRWDAKFELDFRGSQVRAETLDYLALIRRKPTMVIDGAPQLQRFVVARRADGTIKLIAEAGEQIGFLGRLLSRVSGLGLYPVEVKLTRTGNVIRNSFALRGIGGLPPAEETSGALETLMRRMQIRRTELLKPAPPIEKPGTQRFLA